jgi:hypothetical protein
MLIILSYIPCCDLDPLARDQRLEHHRMSTYDGHEYGFILKSYHACRNHGLDTQFVCI